MRLLIAEDELTVRTVLRKTLIKWGYEVTAVENGEEALRILQGADPPQVILLDWIMPKMDGLEVIRRVRAEESGSSLYILLLTAKVETGDIVEGLDAGANDYITKPFNLAELQARVKVGERVMSLQSELSRRVVELQNALDHVETLQGLIPICMHCHNIRDDSDAWTKLESYIEVRSSAEFSHSICPDCLEKHYPEEEEGADEEDGQIEAGRVGAVEMS